MGKILLIFVLITSLFACTEKNNTGVYLDNFEQFISKIEADSLGSIAIEQIETDYKKYSEDLLSLHKSNLSLEDNKEIGRLKARYLKEKMKRDFNDVQNELQKYKEQTKGFIKELFKNEDN